MRSAKQVGLAEGTEAVRQGGSEGGGFSVEVVATDLLKAIMVFPLFELKNGPPDDTLTFYGLIFAKSRVDCG